MKRRLILSQFALRQPAAVMSRAELRRCHKPEIVYSSSDDGLLDEIVAGPRSIFETTTTKESELSYSIRRCLGS